MFSTCGYCSAHGIGDGFSRRNTDAAEEQWVVVLPCQGSLQAAGSSSLHTAFAAHPARSAHQLCCQHTQHLCTHTQSGVVVNTLGTSVHTHMHTLTGKHPASLYTHAQTEVAVNTRGISACKQTHTCTCCCWHSQYCWTYTHVACHGKLTSRQMRSDAGSAAKSADCVQQLCCQQAGHLCTHMLLSGHTQKRPAV